MMKYLPIIMLSCCLCCGLRAQEIVFGSGVAAAGQVYGELHRSDEPLPFGDVDVEFGYVLYRTTVETDIARSAILELGNIRDYAAVYVGDNYAGELTDGNKKLKLTLAGGKSTISIYAENTGRITYGPEILDNSKGIFGNAALDGKELTRWEIIPLKIRETDVKNLDFGQSHDPAFPCFFRGTFNVPVPSDMHIDLTGWGMAEVWINGLYIGSYQGSAAIKSIPVPATALVAGANEAVIFDLRYHQESKARLTDAPVFN